MDSTPLLLILYVSHTLYLSPLSTAVKASEDDDFINPRKSAFACTWPTKQPTQLRCDFRNCRSIQIHRIIASRLEGNMTDCPSLNRSPRTRNIITNCIYILMEDHLFFRALQANCTNRAACQIDPFNELFRDGGTCDDGTNIQTDMRNWVHIEYLCFGDGLPCQPLFQETTVVQTIPPTSATTVAATENTTVSLFTSATTSILMETQGTMKIPTKPKNGNNVANVLIPVLTVVLSVVILLLVACILYQSKACKKKYSKQKMRKQHQTSIIIKNGDHNRSFKIDDDCLHELQTRIGYKDVIRSIPTHTDKPSPNKNKPKIRLSRHSPTIDQSHCRYFLSDSSTTDAGENQRWAKPLPPLPKPKIKHSEVYFTETETENESARNKIEPSTPHIMALERENTVLSST